MINRAPTPAFLPLRWRFGRNRGISYIEILVSIAVFIGFAGVAMVSFTRFNQAAMQSRLLAQATALAQQRIESAMTASWRTSTTRPSILNEGTTTENNLPLNVDATNNATGLSSTFTTTQGQVNATRTTVVTTLTARTLRVSVTVSWEYAGRTTSVNFVTLRASDNI